MRKDVQQFVAKFRQLEAQTFSMTAEEQHFLQLLKERLADAPRETVSPDYHHVPRTIAVASLYAQAGASFVASNAAVFFASRQIPTTLCEIPTEISYYYFALDSERRGKPVVPPQPGLQQDTRLILLEQGFLRVWVTVPAAVKRISQTDLVNWFVSWRRDAPLLFIDLSSHWRAEEARWIADWSDEVWLVFDSDLPRLTRQLIAEPLPAIWQNNQQKIRLIANKWNGELERTSVRKKVEGTLALWGEGIAPNGATVYLPAFDSAEISAAQLKGKLLLEMFAEHAKWFEPLTVVS
ncbi:hypothetical protein [Brevibacillus marinus]|uniref:hypothetical protein n=1 Tax=Brevibacillus marinus TaxID=2496837 RepID=UPI000F824C08|nr:hypothetical protein [Brevibacillus marinus]